MAEPAPGGTQEPSVQLDASSSYSFPAFFRGSEKTRDLVLRVCRNKYDHDSWSALIPSVSKLPPSDVKQFFEALLFVFPKSARFMKIYAETEIRCGRSQNAEQIISRYLSDIKHNLYSVELWQFYLDFLSSKGVRHFTAPLPFFYNPRSHSY